MKMQDRIVLITGAGRGIGRATALLMAREGADIILDAEFPDEIEIVAGEVRALGRRALPVVADMREEQSVGRLIQTAMREFGRIDSMVYSAGVAFHGRVADLSTLDWDHNFGVNIRGMFLLTRALLPIMLDQGAGTIVNISSKLGKEGSATRTAYSSSKHAVIGFTESVALEMKSQGIRVNVICPGPVATPLRAKNYPNEDPSTIASAEEVARVILFLCSDESEGINGAAIDVAWKGQDILPTIEKR
jgi:NAD(P)-dependent dehydrogenase (short-subunit alcohol dehydrogenase family)